MGDQQTTGTPDVTYDLISVAYHALQGAETYATFVRNATDAGDQELIEFFREAQQENARRADRAKELLGQRMG